MYYFFLSHEHVDPERPKCPALLYDFILIRIGGIFFFFFLRRTRKLLFSTRCTRSDLYLTRSKERKNGEGRNYNNYINRFRDVLFFSFPLGHLFSSKFYPYRPRRKYGYVRIVCFRRYTVGFRIKTDFETWPWLACTEKNLPFSSVTLTVRDRSTTIPRVL